MDANNRYVEAVYFCDGLSVQTVVAIGGEKFHEVVERLLVVNRQMKVSLSKPGQGRMANAAYNSHQ